jgi:cytochrome P450
VRVTVVVRVHIPHGALLTTLPAAGNRDPEVFDDPR